MAFKDDIQKLSVQVKERKEYITNEEMTKQALIIPFIQILGFDVFNPIEIRPEYSADFGIKKGEKVDYALFKENEPIIFIEAKSVNENLNNHDAQLARYFNSTKEVKLAILTNGIEYKFFTDLNANNVMDDTPFLNINLLEIKESDIESLNKLRKENGYNFEIEVDGGVSDKNSGILISSGADILVAGSAVFKHEDRAEAIMRIKKVDA